MMKITRKIVLFSILFVLSASPVYSADLIVTCEDEGPCSTSPNSGAALFTENNKLPGDSVTRTITAINNDPDDNCALTLDTKKETQTPADFAAKLFTVIKSGATDLFGARNGTDKASNNKTLADLYSEGQISLGTIPVSSLKEYSWIITFDPNIGNFYKNAQTKFDFDMIFECGIPPTPAAGPTNTPTPGGGGPGGTSCVSPPNAPIITSAVAGKNSVTLNWTEPLEQVDRYFILYGITSGIYSFGSPDIGSKGTSSYTVGSLSGGVTYYFILGAANDCGTSSTSAEISSTPSGGIVSGPPPGFFPLPPGTETLGVATESGLLKTPGYKSPSGEKLGISNEGEGKEICRSFWWLILILFIQAILHKIMRGKYKRWIISNIIITAISAFIIWKYFCIWWLWLLAIFVGIIAIYFIREHKKEETK